MRSVVPCEFCSDRARSTFDNLPLCRWHLILLYLAMPLDWTD